MKSYTDLEQSHKLAEILPIESADMFFSGYAYPKELHLPTFGKTFIKDNIPCWSLAALIDILPDRTCVYKKTFKDGRVKYKGVAEGIKELILKDNPVDVCVAMIEKLHKLKNAAIMTKK